LASMDGPTALSAASARQWLGVWVRLEQARSRALLGQYVTGPGASRPQPTRTHRVGRAMHGKKGQAQQYELDDGTIAGSGRVAGEALIGTRAHIWFTRPTATGPREAVAEGYSAGRPHTIPDCPPLRPTQLRGAVMRPGGSGVGTDNMPYEALQLHPQLTAHWIGQGFWVVKGQGRHGSLLPTPDPRGGAPNILDAVLGPAIDLEVWIPKTAGDIRVAKQRPLQLPTTVRRVFGAAGTDVITPAVEPFLESAQAAVRGGILCKKHQYRVCSPRGARFPRR